MFSMLVIGLGRFGGSLAIKLTELGNEVFAVDKIPEKVNRIAQQVTYAQIGDCMDEDVLRSLGVSNFDYCFVCISDDFQSSLEVTSLLKDLGAKNVVAKANRDIHAKFLLRNGADRVVYPERDMAQRTAVKYSARNAFDYFELTPEYAIFEMQIPKSWEGKSLAELGVRSKYGINVIGRKSGEKLIPVTRAERRLEEGEHLFVAGEKEQLFKMMNHM